MTTGVAGNQARNQPVQVMNTFRRQVNWNDSGIAAGVAGVMLPMGAYIAGVEVEVVTPFDGAAILTVGTNAGMNDIVAAGDVDETVAGVYEVTRGKGRSLTALADILASIKLAGSPTVGQAEVVIFYEGNNG